jgi:hypothetical protein
MTPSTSSNTNNNNASLISIPLLSNDQRLYHLDVPPTHTLTWFRGDLHTITPLLIQQARLILQANPWLTGRLEMQRRNQQPFILTYNPILPPSDVPVLEVSPHTCAIHSDMTVDQLESATYPLRPTNTHGPLWQVLILPSCRCPDQEFSLVVSLSHMVGDGCTFYQLHTMLCFAQDVTSLVIHRIPDSDTHMRAVMGSAESDYFVSVWCLVGAVLGVLSTLMRSWFTRQPVIQQRVHWLDTNKIAEEKQKHRTTETVDYVSTNDVLFSWICNATRTRESSMIVNFRKRLPGFTLKHAGNYISNLVFQTPDFITPTHVRRSVTHLQRCATPSHLPLAWQAMWGPKVIVSNWTAFKKPFPLPHHCCQELLHVPLFHARTFPHHFGLVCVFLPTPGRLALLCVGNASFQQALQQGPYHHVADPKLM